MGDSSGRWDATSFTLGLEGSLILDSGPKSGGRTKVVGTELRREEQCAEAAGDRRRRKGWRVREDEKSELDGVVGRDADAALGRVTG